MLLATNGVGAHGYHHEDIESGIELEQIGVELHEGRQEEGGDDEERRELIYAEEEIHNLLAIRGLPETEFWKVAEGEWEKLAKHFGDRVESKKKQVLDITNEIYQLVGFSCAFQGLLLAAASQGTLLSCSTKGWVLTLSIFASFVTAAGVWQKNTVISDLQKTIDLEDPTRKKYVRRLQRLKEYFGPGFDIRDIIKREEKLLTPDSASRVEKLLRRIKKELCSYRSSIFFCLCIFGILCAVSINEILCNQFQPCAAAPASPPA